MIKLTDYINEDFKLSKHTDINDYALMKMFTDCFKWSTQDAEYFYDKYVKKTNKQGLYQVIRPAIEKHYVAFTKGNVDVAYSEAFIGIMIVILTLIHDNNLFEDLPKLNKVNYKGEIDIYDTGFYMFGAESDIDTSSRSAEYSSRDFFLIIEEEYLNNMKFNKALNEMYNDFKKFRRKYNYLPTVYDVGGFEY